MPPLITPSLLRTLCCASLSCRTLNPKAGNCGGGGGAKEGEDGGLCMAVLDEAGCTHCGVLDAMLGGNGSVPFENDGSTASPSCICACCVRDIIYLHLLSAFSESQIIDHCIRRLILLCDSCLLSLAIQNHQLCPSLSLLTQAIQLK